MVPSFIVSDEPRTSLRSIKELPYDQNVGQCKILMKGITSDFDKENLDESFCLLVKQA